MDSNIITFTRWSIAGRQIVIHKISITFLQKTLDEDRRYRKENYTKAKGKLLGLGRLPLKAVLAITNEVPASIPAISLFISP